MLEELRAQGMALIAYTPLGPWPRVPDPTLARIGARHGKNPGQVTLRWLIQQEGVTAIPRSSREAHAEANLAIFDFALSAAEMAEISALARPRGRRSIPAAWRRAGTERTCAAAGSRAAREAAVVLSPPTRSRNT